MFIVCSGIFLSKSLVKLTLKLIFVATGTSGK